MTELYKALISAQEELTNLDKNSQAYGYQYTDLACLITTVKPILAKHKLGFTQLVESVDVEGKTIPKVSTVLFHESGESIQSGVCAPAVEMKNYVQGFGATITYLRRYSLQSILGLASEDNDAASDKQPSKQAPKEVKKAVKRETSDDL